MCIKKENHLSCRVVFLFMKARTVMELLLLRRESTDSGTFGRLISPISPLKSLYTLELPWRNNATGRSCIPCGVYTCTLSYSPRFKRDLYEVTNVPGRSGVRIHAGNYAGDTSIGFRSNVEGCILLGNASELLGGQNAVTQSRDAMAFFTNTVVNGYQSFSLRICWESKFFYKPIGACPDDMLEVGHYRCPYAASRSREFFVDPKRFISGTPPQA